MRKWIGLVILTLLGTVGETKEQLYLAQLQDWSILLAEDAIPSETYAAQEFQGILAQSAGFEIPILTDASKTEKHVFIGSSSAMQNSSVAFGIDDLGEEGFRIHIKTDNIAIAGGRPRGTLYGVYEFLERYLEIRFLTYDHTYIPRQQHLLIPCEEYRFTPTFSFRWSYYRENEQHPEFAARLRVNTTTHDEKLGGITKQHLISHTLHHYLPAEKYGKEHPEYFALVDGERKTEMWGGGPEPCVTNPDVIEIVAQNVIADLDRQPDWQNISVSQNDNDKYCRCENCEAINQREGTPMGSHLAFVNAVAERVEKKYPHVKIGTLAYWYTRKPPQTIVPRHNVQIQLCSIECCTLHPIDDPDCEKNREFCQDMKDWGAICNDIWIWNYNTNFRYYDLPFPNLRSISANVQYFLENNVHGLFMQANGNGGTGELCDLRNYVISRCMWRPETDSWEAAKEFCRLHYGKAAKTMIRYLTQLHDNAERTGFHPTCFPNPFEVGIQPAFSEKIFGLFQKAMDQAEEEAVQDRVEKASICAYRSVLETCGQYEIKEGTLKVKYPIKYGDIVETYKSLTSKYGQPRAEEWEPISHYYDILNKYTKQGVPADTFENKSWKLTLLPEENGKLVELLYKPKNKHILMPPEYRSVRRPFEYLTLEELGVKGYNHDAPKSFTMEKNDSSLRLVKTFPDGSELVRQIWFDEKKPDIVFFDTCLTHRGQDAKVYQLKVRAEFNTGVSTADNDAIDVGLKKEEWEKWIPAWQKENEAVSVTAENQKSEAVSFFNPRKRYGIMLEYDPASFENPEIDLNQYYPRLILGLLTKEVELKPAETFSCSYRLRYVRKAPKL
ncbi:MAG: DUF4838 domain-containing protein [Candidatus Omnitrophota bacterium]|jgi:hypothetical protein|nr:MAG: DUF4838 domain-containing protein [Candidatus Omnitrophota bacterium]